MNFCDLVVFEQTRPFNLGRKQLLGVSRIYADLRKSLAGGAAKDLLVLAEEQKERG